MSVLANEMWGLVLLEDVDRSMVRCVVCGRKHCSHTNLLSRSGLKHVPGSFSYYSYYSCFFNSKLLVNIQLQMYVLLHNAPLLALHILVNQFEVNCLKLATFYLTVHLQPIISVELVKSNHEVNLKIITKLLIKMLYFQQAYRLLVQNLKWLSCGVCIYLSFYSKIYKINTK